MSKFSTQSMWKLKPEQFIISPPCVPSSALLCLDRFPFAELRYAVATLFFWGIQRGSGNFFASKVTEA